VVTAIVHFKVRRDRIPQVAAAIAELEGIREVYSVTGDSDLVAIVRVDHHEALAEVIADRLGKVQGIEETRTYLAFRTYAASEVDAAFGPEFG
jgi:DNA-binding Lrp family transcriptional regulator